MTPWDLAYLAAAPPYAAIMGYKRLRHGKYRDSLPSMLGRRLPSPPLPAVERCWLHSVSVGETVASGALFRELHSHKPVWRFLSTTTTETGQAQAHKSLPGIERHTYAPLDFSWVVRRFLAAHRPSLYVVLETELWPNLLGECRRRGLPAYLANGKLSARSAARYERLAPLFRPALSAFRLLLMQNDEYAERMARVVGSDRRIRVTGNVKFDALPEPLTPDERTAMRAEWGVGAGEMVLVAGSTHEGEEDLLVSTVAELRAAGLPLRLVIAPRHPERFDAVAERLAKRGPSHRLSAGPAPPGGAPVLLLDKMRVLGRAYGGGDVAIVGGSWNGTGGHNVLEPAVHGLPVLFGPDMHNQPELVRILDAARALLQVPRGSLAEVLARLTGDAGERARLGAAGRAAAEANRGAAKRTAELLLADYDGA